MSLTADQVIAWDKEHILQTYSRLPVVMERGAGALLWDIDGKRYIDLQSGGRAGNALGHAHPAIVRAIAGQAERTLFLSNDFYQPNTARLASELTATTVCKRVFFQNSGAEANECAIKLARKWSRREHGADRFEILTALGSFHGRTLATVTATGQPKYQSGYEPLPGGFRYVPFNDPTALEAAISPQTAAVMLEPILGESGARPATSEYLRTARSLCDRHGLLLILDEVQTGFGRTGSFWAYEQYGIEPDIVTLAKSLGGGLPMGACLAREEVASAFAAGDHGCTFGGNPASAATALAALRVLREENLIEEAMRKGRLLRSLLDDMGKRLDAFTDLRGMGLLIGFDLAKPVARDLMLRALDAGVVISVSSPETVRLLPALVISDELLREAVSILEEVLAGLLDTSS